MNVYIQQQNGQWLNESCYTSWYGFTRMGYDVIPFEYKDIESLPLTKETIVHGGINCVRKAFDIVGAKQPAIHNPHEHLPQYCDRNFTETTLGEINKGNHMDYPFFMKPLEDHKLFTGFVVKSDVDKLKVYGKPPTAKILVSEVIPILSEYRCFIHNRKIVGVKNYTGDFTVFPFGLDLIYNAVDDYKEQPIAYSLDIAMITKNRMQLIEINDGFALGTYGLGPITYCKMIRDRWMEIMKTSK